MRGVWLEDGTFRLDHDLPLPTTAPHEVLIRVSLAGICGTDLELARGYASFRGIPGHEFVGRVASAPEHEEWMGRRVVGEINVTCGRCGTCRAGRRTHCDHRTVLGISGRQGAFAEYVTLPVENLHHVPDTMPDDVAVFTEPLAAALQIQEQITIDSTDRVVVIGDGRLGTLVAQTLALTGCRLLVIGRHPAKLEVLRQLGIATGLAADLPERTADVAVECTGNPTGFGVARRALRPCGTLVLKSTYHGPAHVDLSRIVVDEMTVIGSRCGPFTPALALLARGDIDVASLVDARYPMAAAVQAFEHAARPGTRKVLLEAD